MKGSIISRFYFYIFVLYLGTVAAATLGASISATGGAELLGVPLGRDSLYETSIAGINSSEKQATFRVSIAPNEERFYEPLRELDWLIPFPDTVSASPMDRTPSIALITRFPDDQYLRNRRFSASAIVQQAAEGMISLGVALKIRIETESSREIPEVIYPKRLSLFPAVLEMLEDIDSVWLVNASETTDTVEVYWSKSLSRRENSGEVKIFKKIFLWELPADIIFLEPGQGEWIFISKKEKDFVLKGYIVCIGKKNSLYCRIGD